MHRLAVEPARHPGAQREQPIEILPGRNAHARKEIGHVLGCDVAARARRMRAAADAAEARVEARDAFLPGREDVRSLLAFRKASAGEMNVSYARPNYESTREKACTVEAN